MVFTTLSINANQNAAWSAFFPLLIILSLCLMNQIQTVLLTVKQLNFTRKTNGSMRSVCQLLSSRAGGTADLTLQNRTLCGVSWEFSSVNCEEVSFFFFFFLSLSLTQISYCYDALYPKSIPFSPWRSCAQPIISHGHFLTKKWLYILLAWTIWGPFFQEEEPNSSEWTRCRPAIIELVLTQCELTFKWSCSAIFVCSVTCLEACFFIFYSMCYWMPLAYYIIIIHFEFCVQDQCLYSLICLFFVFNMVKRKTNQHKILV